MGGGRQEGRFQLHRKISRLWLGTHPGDQDFRTEFAPLCVSAETLRPPAGRVLLEDSHEKNHRQQKHMQKTFTSFKGVTVNWLK